MMGLGLVWATSYDTGLDGVLEGLQLDGPPTDGTGRWVGGRLRFTLQKGVHGDGAALSCEWVVGHRRLALGRHHPRTVSRPFTPVKRRAQAASP
jgi:hypothetical protein